MHHLGHDLQLQFYPHHINSDYIGIQLRPDSQSFLKQHKIVILDHLNPEKDITSPIIDYLQGSNGMYRLLMTDIENGNYKLDNKLIIKIILYLDS